MFKCKQTLDYWLNMSGKDEDAKKWNKISQNHVAKTMFLGRTWRTQTQKPKNTNHTVKPKISLLDLETHFSRSPQTTLPILNIAESKKLIKNIESSITCMKFQFLKLLKLIASIFDNFRA
jgi:hypothetical protein